MHQLGSALEICLMKEASHKAPYSIWSHSYESKTGKFVEKKKVSVCSGLIEEESESVSRIQLFVTPWTVARQAPLSMKCSRQESSSR